MEEPDFRSIRESKKLTLKDIYKSTRISITNLAAIENGDFHLLPPPVFTRSFIKMYAKVLGVDSGPTLARYEKYLETLNTPQHEAEAKAETEEIPVLPSSSRKGNYRALLWGSLIFITAGVLIFSLASYQSEIETPADKVAEPAQKTLTTGSAEEMKTGDKSETPDLTNQAMKTQEESSSAPLSVQIKQPAKEAKEVKEAIKKPDDREPRREASQEVDRNDEIPGKYPLTMVAREVTWLRIKIDKKPSYQVLLQPGEKIHKTASEFVIDIGNAGGVDVEFQGKSLGNLGKQGEVVHLKLP